jgi:YHS domain-containing protein
MSMAKDPICGMMVDEKKAKFKSDYNGKTYYFCAPSCKATFDKDPAKYASGSGGKSGGGCCCCGGH